MANQEETFLHSRRRGVLDRPGQGLRLVCELVRIQGHGLPRDASAGFH